MIIVVCTSLAFIAAMSLFVVSGIGGVLLFLYVKFFVFGYMCMCVLIMDVCIVMCWFEMCVEMVMFG